MTDIAGLVVGTIPIAVLFQNCLIFYDQIQSLKFKTDDVNYYLLRTHWEHFKLLILKERLGDSHITQHVAIYRLIEATLKEQETTLSRLCQLLFIHSSLLRENGSNASKSNSGWTNALKWISSHQQEMKDKVSRLKDLNTQLEEFLTHEQLIGLNFRLVAESVATSNLTQLRRIQNVSQNAYPMISRAAEVRCLRVENLSGTRTEGPTVPKFQIMDPERISWVSSTRGVNVHYTEWECKASLRWSAGEETALGMYKGAASHPDQDQPVLVEWRSRFKNNNSVEDHKYRLDQLVLAVSRMAQQSSTIPTPSYSLSVSRSNPMPAITTGISNSQEDIHFGILRCMGWLPVAVDDFSRIGLVFQFPLGRSRNPVSLHEKIKQDRRRSAITPSLGIRFLIVTRLIQHVANLITVGWVHNSIRSHNVLIFQPEVDNSATNSASCSSPFQSQLLPAIGSSTQDRAGNRDSQLHKYDEMYLTGFSYARPGDAPKPTHLSSLPSQDLAFALYRPPKSVEEKVIAPQTSSTKPPITPNSSAIAPPSPSASTSLPETTTVSDQSVEHEIDLRSQQNAYKDIYGLGVILLEIAFWRTIDSIYKEYRRSRRMPDSNSNINDPDISERNKSLASDFQNSPQFQSIVASLGSRVGELYQGVVQKCLALDGWPMPRKSRNSESSMRDTQSQSGGDDRLTDDQRNVTDTGQDGDEQTQRHREVQFLESILTALSQCVA